MMIPYAALTFRFCLAEHHRELILSKLRLPSIRKAKAA
jgi:hypothetical protein